MPASLIARVLGWTGIPQWLLELIVIVLAIFVFALWERHQGAQKCVRADEKVVAKQERANAQSYAQGVTTVFQEASDYDRAIHAPVERPFTVRLCKSPDIHPAAQDSTPGARDPETPSVPDPIAIATVQPDIGPELLAIGRDADAQVTALQSYIRDVCKPANGP